MKSNHNVSGTKRQKYRVAAKRAVDGVWPKLLKFMDTGKNGKISRKEYQNWLHKKGKPFSVSRWQQLDHNRNGQLTKQEFQNDVLFSKCAKGGVRANKGSKKFFKTCVGKRIYINI